MTLVEVLFWMWLGSIVGAALVSPIKEAGNSALSMFATLPVWVFMAVPLTMIGWIAQVVVA